MLGFVSVNIKGAIEFVIKQLHLLDNNNNFLSCWFVVRFKIAINFEA